MKISIWLPSIVFAWHGVYPSTWMSSMCRLALLAGLMRKPNMIYYTGMYMLRIYVRRSICHRFASVSQIATTKTTTAAAAGQQQHRQRPISNKLQGPKRQLLQMARMKWKAHRMARSLRIYFNKRKEENERVNIYRVGSAGNTRTRYISWGAALKAIGNYNHVCAYVSGNTSLPGYQR